MTKPRILIIEDEILIAREPEAKLKGLRLPWSTSAVIGGLQVAGVSSDAIRADIAGLDRPTVT